jgi:hypothetical protein
MGLNNISLRFITVLIAQSSHLLRQELLEVPTEWVFEDEGFSGATLERPGLERVRDLAAEGQIQVVLAYSPDRLSRKYSYENLLIEEFAKHGVETLFVNAKVLPPTPIRCQFGCSKQLLLGANRLLRDEIRAMAAIA